MSAFSGSNFPNLWAVRSIETLLWEVLIENLLFERIGLKLQKLTQKAFKRRFSSRGFCLKKIWKCHDSRPLAKPGRWDRWSLEGQSAYGDLHCRSWLVSRLQHRSTWRLVELVEQKSVPQFTSTREQVKQGDRRRNCLEDSHWTASSCQLLSRYFN